MCEVNFAETGKTVYNKRERQKQIMGRYSVVIRYCNVDNIYVASVPELKGCMAHGETQADALEEIQTAIELWLETAKEVGAYIPEPAYMPVPQTNLKSTWLNAKN